MQQNHKFPYKWTLENANFEKNKGKVFTCFACGGGSTMGYKLAGFDVIGFNEIDKKMASCYIENHHPKYQYIEPIQTFKNRDDLPSELFDLDILDGSPPCSSFSMAGSREKAWGKEKKFREGQAKQVLDTLFFDFIDLAKKLQPKIVIAENVKGILLGNAKKYVEKIHSEFYDAGYFSKHFLLNASKMGVPQRRERVFFIAIRQDLVKFLPKDLFEEFPMLDLTFNECDIPFGEYRSEIGNELALSETRLNLLKHFQIGDKCISDINERLYNKISGFNALLINDNNVCPTITSGEINYRTFDKLPLSEMDYILSGTFPTDYNFLNQQVKYMVGMSVPPIMTAQIATKIHEQWLSKIKITKL